MDIKAIGESVIIDTKNYQLLMDIADNLAGSDSLKAKEFAVRFMEIMGAAPKANTLIAPLFDQLGTRIDTATESILNKFEYGTNTVGIQLKKLDEIDGLATKLQEIGNAVEELATNPDKKGSPADVKLSDEQINGLLGHLRPTATNSDSEAEPLDETTMRKALAYTTECINSNTNDKVAEMIASQMGREAADTTNLLEQLREKEQQVADLTAANERLEQEKTGLLARMQADLSVLVGKLPDCAKCARVEATTTQSASMTSNNSPPLDTKSQQYEGFIRRWAEKLTSAKRFPLSSGSKNLRKRGLGDDSIIEFGKMFDPKTQLHFAKLVDNVPFPTFKDDDAFVAYFLNGSPFSDN